MKTPYRSTRAAGRLLGRTLLGGLLLCCLTDVACPQTKTAPASVDVMRRPLDLIPAGTVIDKEPPRGWTHLIIKSHPRPSAGDTDQLTALSDRLARWLFTAIVARVDPLETGSVDSPVGGGKSYRLGKVAVGVGARVGDKDVILTPETARHLGANPGLLGGIVLAKAQERLEDVTVAARARTMVLIDAPGLMPRQGHHQPVLLRYALLVDAQNGQLQTLLWLIDGAVTDGPASAIQWLPANKIEDCVLHVDAREFGLAGPTEKAFAMKALPKGQKEIVIPKDLKRPLIRNRFTAETAADVEKKLRQLLAEAAKK